MLLVDDELDPVQQRALEDALSARVVDRTQLILDIFAQHAVSAEEAQVELAQLGTTFRACAACGSTSSGRRAEAAPRASAVGWARAGRASRRPTVGSRTAGSRCSGASATWRTPGDATQARARSETPTVALAGYTNVGKSTLLNALTGAEAPSRTGSSRRSTHDAGLRARREALPRDGHRRLHPPLPTQLVEGFASTLEETLVADVVLHVVDGSLPRTCSTSRSSRSTVLCEIGARP